MSTTGVKQIIFTESSGGSNRQIVVRGNYVRGTEFVIGSVSFDAEFKASPIAHPFTMGKHIKKSVFTDWAAVNKFDILEQGIDTQVPYVKTIAINGGKTVITITFNQKINKTGDAAALKAAITLATNGTTFNALGGSDTIGTVDGSAATLIITLNTATVTTTNKIKIAAGAIKDPSNNLNNLITTTAI